MSKISAYPAASSPLTGTEQVPVTQGGATVKATTAQIAALAAGVTTLEAITDIDHTTEASGKVLSATPSNGKAFSFVTPASGGGGGGGSTLRVPIGTVPAVDPTAIQVFAVYPDVNAVPLMTSANTPSGVVTASSFYGGSATTTPYHAFTRNPMSEGWLTDGTQSGFLQYQFPSATTITSYQVCAWSVDNFPSRSPTAWTMQGSNDGTTWTILDTQTKDVSFWVQYKLSDPFPIAGPTAYLYYRFNVTANAGNAYMGVGQLALLAPGGASGAAQLRYIDNVGGIHIL